MFFSTPQASTATLVQQLVQPAQQGHTAEGALSKDAKALLARVKLSPKVRCSKPHLLGVELHVVQHVDLQEHVPHEGGQHGAAL